MSWQMSMEISPGYIQSNQYEFLKGIIEGTNDEIFMFCSWIPSSCTFSGSPDWTVVQTVWRAGVQTVLYIATRLLRAASVRRHPRRECGVLLSRAWCVVCETLGGPPAPVTPSPGSDYESGDHEMGKWWRMKPFRSSSIVTSVQMWWK